MFAHIQQPWVSAVHYADSPHWGYHDSQRMARNSARKYLCRNPSGFPNFLPLAQTIRGTLTNSMGTRSGFCPQRTDVDSPWAGTSHHWPMWGPHGPVTLCYWSTNKCLLNLMKRVGS